uniref:Polyprotein n=1 Tax=Peronospora matthiolae TaxID=2874970 RepID=A0AAV1TS81_9STRA
MMSTKRAEVLLGSGNYFHWEFNMRMSLARKGLLAHVEVVKAESEITEAWLVNDAKALGIIAQGVELQHQTKIRSSTRAIQAWVTLREFYNRTTLHNRVTMTRRLHEFKMDAGTAITKHLDAFDELVVGLQTLGEPVDEARQLVVLLSSLPAENELISSIIENVKDITLIEVKEKLLKECERLEKKDTTSERAFKVNAGRFKGNKRSGRKWSDQKKNSSGFQGKCFKCNKVGHMKRDCQEGTTDGDAVFVVSTERVNGWLIDSGATAHMTPHRSDLFEYENVNGGIEVTIADGKKLQVTGRGTVRLLGLDGKRIKMVEVLHIPGLDRRLLSVGKLADRGLNVGFQRSSCVIWGAASAIAKGKKIGKAYMLDCEQEEARFVQYAGADSKWELWHARLGHPNQDALDKTRHATNGIPAVGQPPQSLCGGCMKGKQTVAKFPHCSSSKTSRVLELVHTDMMGPMNNPSKGGAKYVLTFVDDYSRYVVAYFLKKKSEVAIKLREFMTFYENQRGERMKCLRSDNGTEFVNQEMTKICMLNGIVHQRTVPYSPQQNGVAERMNRTIMERSRSMLYYKGVPMEWWAEAVSTALGFKVKPTLDHLRVFGSRGYAHIDEAKRTKLEPKSFRCLLLGYPENVNGYRVYDLDASKVKVSRSVKLDEREVDGIYDTLPAQIETVIHVSTDADDEVTLAPVELQPVEAEPMEGVENDAPDVEMESMQPIQDAIPPLLMPQERSAPTGFELEPYCGPPTIFEDDQVVFHTPRDRFRSSREPVFLLEEGTNAEEEWKSEGRDGPSYPKRARIDEDGLIAEAILTYAAIIDTVDLPTTYAQNYVCQLNKAIYGLKQAASAWNKTIHRVFLGYGFKSCGADQCVYVKRSKSNFIYVCLYADDMIIAAKTSDEIDDVKNALKSVFKMKELGPAKFILGMEIDHNMTAGTLMIKQTRYIDDVAKRFGQENAKSVDNPCATGLKLSKSQSPATDEERRKMQSRPYRSLIGCLLYITTCTRPDISFVVTQLSRFLENPGAQHWNAAIRVLRYLKTTRQHGIIYRGGTGSVTAEAYSDADWGSNLDDRRSVSGVMIMIGNAPVVFKSKFQRTVALSSAEAEYMALSLCVQEVLWTRAILTDMGMVQMNATQIWEDNQGAIALAQNAGYHARTKHVDIRHHFIRETIEDGTVAVAYVDTKHQLADILTKALGSKTFKFLRDANSIQCKETKQ